MRKKLFLLSALLIIGATSKAKEVGQELSIDEIQEVLIPEIDVEAINSSDVLNNKEVLVFLNGQYLKEKNKKIKDMKIIFNDLDKEPPITPEPPINPPVEPPVNPEPPIKPPVIPPLEPIIWEEGIDILEKIHSTDRNLQTSKNYSALKGIQGAKIINNFEIKVNGLELKGIEIENSYAENNGDINVDIGSAFHLSKNSNGLNKGTINLNSDQSIGGDIRDGSFTNEGTINANGGAYGIQVWDNLATTGTEAINKGTINVLGNLSIGMRIAGGRSNKGFINEGDINLSERATGMSLQGNSEIERLKGVNNGNIKASYGHAVNLHYADFENNGKININNPNSTVVVFDTGANTFTNNGEVFIQKGNLSKGSFVTKDDTFMNNGTVTSMDSYLDLTNSKFIQGATGKINARKVIGDIIMATELYTSNTEKELSIENHEGHILSESALYNVSSNKLDKKYEVKLSRKDFRDVVSESGISSYLEKNYTQTNNALKDKLYNEIKNNATEDGLNKTVNTLFGNELLPNLNKQTLDLVKSNKETLKENVFNEKATKEIRTIAGYGYKKDEVKSSNLSGYNETINSIFLGLDKEVMQNLRLGGVLTLGELNSSYTVQNANRKDSNLQGNIFTQYEKEGLNYVFNGFFGGTNGDLKRNIQLDTINSRLRTKLENRYIGFNSILNKKINQDGFIIKPQFELNGTYIKTNGLKESGEYGIKTSKADIKSFEVGTGVTLERSFATSEYIITPKLGANYFYELGSPYKAFEGQMLDISIDKFEISKNPIERGRTEVLLGLDIEKGNLKIYGDFKYLVNREDKQLSAGLIYKFN